ncbi:MAG TPA: intradiol ring-cleavage dioxygenase [Lapillicoccus sp.]|jgi:protocatechuate 3,4-dioxygenase beta subunit|uniref:intradiol ring-cleavage dioxygenase n=1 Tax=Lapillicoccus sp. TaxID=1909287 RepID=UPI002F92709A
MTTRRNDRHAALTDAVTRRESDWVDADGHEIHDHDRGLLYDLGTMNRRRALGVLGGVGALAALAACGTGTGSAATGASGSSSGSSTTSASADGTLTEVPDETSGPYPADGSNGVNVLDDSGIVRADIRSSFGSSTTTAAGVPLTIKLTVRDTSTGAAKTGAAVYLWHCDRDGQYSLYSSAITSENYLRGVQETDANGTVTFTSIFPACYSGRWPHIHFEVYSSVADATSSGPIVKTSQIALPQEACDAVYATDGYSASVGNLSQVSLQRDNVFGNDAGIHQIATMSGDTSSGYTSALTVGV